MKSNKLSILKLLAVAMVAMVATYGCDSIFDSGEIEYEGPDQLEFQPLSQTYTLGASTSGSTAPINVQLIGPQRDSDLSVNFVVVDSLSTDNWEDNATLPTTSVTIPANSSSASFAIDVTGENLEAGEIVQLVLMLQDNTEQDVTAAENLDQYTLTIQGGG